MMDKFATVHKIKGQISEYQEAIRYLRTSLMREVARLHIEEGVPLAAIGRNLRITRQRASQIFLENGVSPDTPDGGDGVESGYGPIKPPESDHNGPDHPDNTGNPAELRTP